MKTLVQTSLSLFALLCLGVLSSCSSSRVGGDEDYFDNYRSYSSVAEKREDFLANSHMQDKFDELFNDGDTKERMLTLFEQQREIFYYNQSLVYVFDQALEDGYSPMDSDLYMHLWDGRDSKEHQDEYLAYILVMLDEISRSQDDREKAQKAGFILDEIFVFLNGLEDHEKLAFVDVMDHYRMYEIPEEGRQKSASSSDITLPFHSFESYGFSWSDFYEQHSPELEEQTLKRHSLDRLKERYFGQGSHKRSIYPSVGGAGNIIGNEFPEGVWSLTYDDGPRAGRTQEILRLLERSNMKATFFWLAQNARRHPQIVEHAKRLGMELANHSYTHANMTNERRRSREHEIIESTNVLENVYRRQVKFFRLPYGSGVHDRDIRSLIADRGMIHVFWNVDSLDWQDRDPRSIVNRVVSQMESRGKGVILFHDIHQQSVEATRLFLDYVERANRFEKRWDFKKLNEIVTYINENPRTYDGPQTWVNLNVRTGPGTDYRVCAILPPGTKLELHERVGSFYRASVIDAPSGLQRDLEGCRGSVYVSANPDYVR